MPEEDVAATDAVTGATSTTVEAANNDAESFQPRTKEELLEHLVHSVSKKLMQRFGLDEEKQALVPTVALEIIATVRKESDQLLRREVAEKFPYLKFLLDSVGEEDNFGDRCIELLCKMSRFIHPIGK